MTQFNIRVKSYCRLTLLRTLIFNFERLDILRDSIRHPSKKFIVVWICSELRYSISSISIDSMTQSEIRVESYCRLNLLWASTFNSERLDILRDSIRHPRKKVIVVWIWSELRYSISSVSIYYETQSDIRVKSYCRLNLFRDSTFNFGRLYILQDSIGHPFKKLLSFVAQIFDIQFRASG